jgi:hypothetical protein
VEAGVAGDERATAIISDNWTPLSGWLDRSHAWRGLKVDRLRYLWGRHLGALCRNGLAIVVIARWFSAVAG